MSETTKEEDCDDDAEAFRDRSPLPLFPPVPGEGEDASMKLSGLMSTKSRRWECSDWFI